MHGVMHIIDSIVNSPPPNIGPLFCLTTVTSHFLLANLAYKFSVCHPKVLYIEYTNVSVCNTTIYFTYIKIVYCQGDIFRPSLGHLQALKPVKLNPSTYIRIRDPDS